MHLTVIDVKTIEFIFVIQLQATIHKKIIEKNSIEDIEISIEEELQLPRIKKYVKSVDPESTSLVFVDIFCLYIDFFHESLKSPLGSNLMRQKSF